MQNVHERGVGQSLCYTDNNHSTWSRSTIAEIDKFGAKLLIECPAKAARDFLLQCNYSVSYLSTSLHLSSNGDLNLDTSLDVDDDLLDDLSWGVKAN